MKTGETLFDGIQEGEDRNITDISILGDGCAAMFNGPRKQGH